MSKNPNQDAEFLFQLQQEVSERLRDLRLVEAETCSILLLPSAKNLDEPIYDVFWVNGPARFFDVFLMDDGKVVGSALRVHEAQVKRAAERLQIINRFNYSYKSSGNEVEVNTGVDGFERINGRMTIWGSPLVIIERRKLENGEVVDTMLLRNGTASCLKFANRYWTIYGLGGKRTVLSTEDVQLLYYAENRLVARIGQEQEGKFS